VECLAFSAPPYWCHPTSNTGGSVPLSKCVRQQQRRRVTDYNGHLGGDPAYAAGFQAAVKNVTTIGLSFGGGCFFENGVGTSDGSGTFTLDTFATS